MKPSRKVVSLSAWAVEGAAAVKKLYEHVLDRVPADKEVAYWLDRFNSGMSYESVAKSFVESREYKGRFSTYAIPGHPKVHGVFGDQKLSRPGATYVFSMPQATGTPKSTAVKDLSLFAAGTKIGICNNGAVCHTAIMSWSPGGRIKRYQVQANSQIVIPAEDLRSSLIGEDDCPTSGW